MKIAKQLLKEFWFPLLGAIIWTVYALWNELGSPQSDQVRKYITVFGPSFFLMSWTTGQFFRIKKQVTVESNLDSIETRVKNLLSLLERQSETLVAHITGGNSFLYLKPTSAFDWDDGEIVFMAPFILVGQFGIESVDIRFVAGWVNWIDKQQVFKNVNSKTIGRTFTQIKAPISKDKPARFQILYFANNGSWYQDISISRNNGGFNVTTKVFPAVEGASSPSFDEEYVVEYVSIEGRTNMSTEN